jgi:hypothetical protein
LKVSLLYLYMNFCLEGTEAKVLISSLFPPLSSWYRTPRRVHYSEDMCFFPSPLFILYAPLMSCNSQGKLKNASVPKISKLSFLTKRGPAFGTEGRIPRRCKPPKVMWDIFLYVTEQHGMPNKCAPPPDTGRCMHPANTIRNLPLIRTC